MKNFEIVKLFLKGLWNGGIRVRMKLGAVICAMLLVAVLVGAFVLTLLVPEVGIGTVVIGLCASMIAIPVVFFLRGWFCKFSWTEEYATRVREQLDPSTKRARRSSRKETPMPKAFVQPTVTTLVAPREQSLNKTAAVASILGVAVALVVGAVVLLTQLPYLITLYGWTVVLGIAGLVVLVIVAFLVAVFRRQIASWWLRARRVVVTVAVLLTVVAAVVFLVLPSTGLQFPVMSGPLPTPSPESANVQLAPPLEEGRVDVQALIDMKQDVYTEIFSVAKVVNILQSSVVRFRDNVLASEGRQYPDFQQFAHREHGLLQAYDDLETWLALGYVDSASSEPVFGSLEYRLSELEKGGNIDPLTAGVANGLGKTLVRRCSASLVIAVGNLTVPEGADINVVLKENSGRWPENMLPYWDAARQNIADFNACAEEYNQAVRALVLPEGVTPVYLVTFEGDFVAPLQEILSPGVVEKQVMATSIPMMPPPVEPTLWAAATVLPSPMPVPESAALPTSTPVPAITAEGIAAVDAALLERYGSPEAMGYAVARQDALAKLESGVPLEEVLSGIRASYVPPTVVHYSLEECHYWLNGKWYGYYPAIGELRRVWGISEERAKEFLLRAYQESCGSGVRQECDLDRYAPIPVPVLPPLPTSTAPASTQVVEFCAYGGGSYRPGDTIFYATAMGGGYAGATQGGEFRFSYVTDEGMTVLAYMPKDAREPTTTFTLQYSKLQVTGGGYRLKVNQGDFRITFTALGEGGAYDPRLHISAGLGVYDAGLPAMATTCYP